jgi:hypothetical protein
LEALGALDEKEEVVLVGIDALIAQREGDLLRATGQEVLEGRRCAADVFDTPRLSVGFRMNYSPESSRKLST